MWIKGFSSILNPLNFNKPTATKAGDSDADRDADGRRLPEEPQQEEGSFETEEEFNESLEFLKSTKGFEENGLRVEVSTVNNLKEIQIKTPEGQIVKR